MQRNLMIAVLFLILLAGGAYFFMGDPASIDDNSTDQVVSLDDPIERDQRTSRDSSSNSNASASNASTTRKPKRDNAQPRVIVPRPEPTKELAGKASVRGAVTWRDSARSGVEVQLYDSATGAFAGSAKSDEEGVFLIEGVTTGRDFLAAVIESPWAVSWTHASATENQAESDKPSDASKLPTITLAREALLTLSVYEAGQLMTPIGGAQLHLDDIAPEEAMLLGIANGKKGLRDLKTDNTGMLYLRAIPPARRVLRVSAKGYFASEWDEETSALQIADFRADQPTAATFRLKQAAAIKGILVSDNGGAPIENAVLEIGHDIGDVFTAGLSNLDGSFAFSSVPIHPQQMLVPGIVLRIQHPQFAMKKIELNDLKPGEERDLGTIKLSVGRTINGRVVNDAQEPIAGALVFINERDNGGQTETAKIFGVRQTERFQSATTDADGRFKIASLPLPIEIMPTQVFARAKGYGLGSANILPVASEEPEILITLKPAGSIIGVVQDQRGTPIPGAMVVAIDESARFAQAILPSMLGNAQTSEGGTFAGEIRTDENGEFEISDLPEGKYTVVAYRESYRRSKSESLSVRTGQASETTLTLLSGGVIWGVYYGEDGTPTAGTSISAFTMRMGDPKFGNATTNEQGEYRIEELDPGTYLVRAGGMASMMSGFRLNTDDSVTLAAGQEVRRDIYAIAPGTVTLTGKITLDAKPYKQRFTLSGGGFDGNSTQVVTCNKDGEYRVNNVYPGSYTAFLGGMGPGGGGGGGSFQVMQRREFRVDRSPDEQRVDLDFLTASVSGVVLMKNGAPLPDEVVVVAVSVQDDDESDDGYQPSASEQIFPQFTEQTKPKEDGTFRITGLSPGRYRFIARSRDAGYVSSGEYNVEKDLTGVRLELEGGSGKLIGNVLNYVPPSSESADIASAMEAFGLVRFYDQSGTELQFGRLGGGGGPGGASDNGVRIDFDAETGLGAFEIEGVPAGTWDVTFQISNYVPVQLKNVQILAEVDNAQTFALARSGDLEIEILNGDLDPTAASELKYAITASNGLAYIKEFTFVDLMVNLLNPKDKNTFILKDFPPDRYTMELKIPGYYPEVVEFSIASEQVTPVKVNFRRDPTAQPESQD